MINDALVIYKAEACLGDVLLIHLAIAYINKYGFDMLYQVMNKANGKELARGKTNMCVLIIAGERWLQYQKSYWQ
ncbi:hypothetical protein SanaruYs_29430 [Chryseotalea sanaruensis]|uniref:Uncharacterized protein n=1 Tax=Chryseotalea sanaruensis TaxID=2482724 RepID=A0A401UCT4_9BACT|nr:hypothetical protein SanaruYs_29430 [Chryseotalea sanaruensis]